MVERMRKAGEPQCIAESRVCSKDDWMKKGRNERDRERERGLLPGLQWKRKGRWQMRREQLLVDICYSKSDVDVGREWENAGIDLQIAQASSEHLFVSVCEKAAGACVLNAFQRWLRACAACAHVQVCVAEICCVCCTCVFETCSALISRRAVQHVWEEACEMFSGCVIEVRGREWGRWLSRKLRGGKAFDL